MDGYVVIKAKMDLKQLERDLETSKKELKGYEKEAESLTDKKVKLEFDMSQNEEKLNNLQDKIEEVGDKIHEAQGYLSKPDAQHDVDSTTKELEKLNSQYDSLIQKSMLLGNTYEYQRGVLSNIDGKISQNTSNQENVKASIDEQTKRLDEQKQAYEDINQKIIEEKQRKEESKKVTEETGIEYDSIGSSLGKVIKKVTKWGLAVFGVRSAYNFVRQAVSTLSQYNEQMGTDIEYIRFALASTLQPVIEWLIQAVYKLLSAIGGIVQKVFGVNIFANATTKAFNKSNKEAKKLSKTLAGFDEANVLGGASSGSAGGVKTPSMDLSKGNFLDIDPEKIVTTIVDVLDKIKIKIDEFIGKIKENILKVLKELGAPEWLIQSVGLVIDGIGLVIKGLIDIIKGVVQTIVGFLTGNTEMVKEGFNNLINGILQVLSGLIGIIAGILYSILSVVKSVFDGAWNFIKSVFNWILNIAKSVFNGIKSVFSTIGDFFKSVFNKVWDIVRGVFDKIKGAINGVKTTFSNVFDSLWSIAKGPLNLIIDGINKLIKGANKFKIEIPDWVPEVGGKKFGVNIPTIPKLAKGGIINLPGSGTMVGNAIGGERGAEGVIPLTDSQQMALLGEAIGRYITINASITNTMNGRIISRELQKINNQNNFAYNR